jgi:hypothetical protein
MLRKNEVVIIISQSRQEMELPIFNAVLVEDMAALNRGDCWKKPLRYSAG